MNVSSARPLDAKHSFWRMLLGDKIRPSPKPPPPEKTPETILDVGCGVGSLCLDMAHEYPGARVFGIDVKPVTINFDRNQLPINCTFITGDILTTDDFQPGQFDLIISRDIASEIPIVNWASYVNRLFELLKPGGWVHFIEMDPWPYTDDDTLSKNSAWVQYTEAMQQMMCVRGLQFYGLPEGLEASIQAMRPASTTTKTYRANVGKWTKGTHFSRSNAETGADRKKHQPGEMLSRIWRASVDTNLPRLGEFLGDPKAAQKICEGAKAEETRLRPHVYFKMYSPPCILRDLCVLIAV